MGCKYRFNFSRFDPETSYFYLIIYSSDEFNISIFLKTGFISGFVHFRTIRSKGINNKFLVRFLRLIVIPRGNLCSTDTQFSYQTNSDRLIVFIQNVDFIVHQWLSNWRKCFVQLLRFFQKMTRNNMCFNRSVLILQNTAFRIRNPVFYFRSHAKLFSGGY
ncbi:hypothetical protein D3C71_691630 [compost metagenome]